MSSKAEKTSDRSRKHTQLSIFFRNPLLLKIVAWLGSLSFIGNTGIVWADLQPVVTSQTETNAIVAASTATDANALAPGAKEIYGPFFPVARQQSPTPVTPDKLPNREVPTAVSPASAKISPTGTIVRPQHTDLTTADNYTVGVNNSANSPEPAIEITVPAPLSNIIPGRTAEVATMTRSQVQPKFERLPASIDPDTNNVKFVRPTASIPPAANSTKFVRPPASISQSVPTTSIQQRSVATAASNGYRAVPQVPSLTASTSKLATVKTTVVAPMRSPVAPGRSMPQLELNSSPATLAATPSTPSTATKIVVQPVARLPIVTGKSVPTVPAIPTVRPASARGQSAPLALVNQGASNYHAELIYPLSSPAPTTSKFGWRTHPITGSRRFHSGVDIGAPMGAPVVAAGGGTIISAGWQGGYGKAIVIQHNGVQQTLYGHLSEIFVQPGQTVEPGTVIGRVGSTGNSTGPHLHFETRMSTTDGWVAVDPGAEIEYALDNLRRSMPFAQRDLPPGYN